MSEDNVTVPKKEYEELKKTVAKLKAQMKQSPVEGGKGFKLGGGAMDMFSEGSEFYKANREAIKNTGALLSDLSGPDGFVTKFSMLAEGTLGIFDNIAPGVQAINELGASMRTFAMTQKDTQGDLVRTAAVFKRLGVETADFSAVLDSARIGFGDTGKDALALARHVGEIGNATGVGMGKAMKNFRSAQSSMAYDSKKLMENFTALQFTAATTGVSFDKLTSQFGDSMDTFEGSASKAGNLNAILGRSVFNSIDLLGKTEAERVQTIVQGIRQSTNTEALSKNKFQLKAVAKGLGLTPDETRKLLAGQTSVDEVLAGKGPKDEREAAISRMATLLTQSDGVNEGLQGFIKLLRSSRPLQENFNAAANELQRTAFRNLAQALGMGTNLTPASLLVKFENTLKSLSVGDAQTQISIAKETMKSFFDQDVAKALVSGKKENERSAAVNKKIDKMENLLSRIKDGEAQPAETPAEKARKVKTGLNAEAKNTIIEQVRAGKIEIVEALMKAITSVGINVDGAKFGQFIPSPDKL